MEDKQTIYFAGVDDGSEETISMILTLLGIFATVAFLTVFIYHIVNH